MVLIVFAGIAEFEPALMHERTSTAELQRGGTVCTSVDRWALSAEQLVLGRRLVEEQRKRRTMLPRCGGRVPSYVPCSGRRAISRRSRNPISLL
jgi:hypothetical protein